MKSILKLISIIALASQFFNVAGIDCWKLDASRRVRNTFPIYFPTKEACLKVFPGSNLCTKTTLENATLCYANNSNWPYQPPYY